MSYTDPQSQYYHTNFRNGESSSSHSHIRPNNDSDQQIALEIARERSTNPYDLENEHPLVREQFDYLASTSNYTHKPPPRTQPSPSDAPQAIPKTENSVAGDRLGITTAERREQNKLLQSDKNKKIPPLPNGSFNQGLRGPEDTQQDFNTYPRSAGINTTPTEYNAPLNRGQLHPSNSKRSSPQGNSSASVPFAPVFPQSIPENSSPPDTAEDPLQCEICQLPKPRCLICNVCQIVFCEECWPEYLPHKPGRKNPIRGVRLQKHEPIDPVVEAKLDRILEPQIQEPEQEALLDQDEDTAWFAVVKDDADDLIFQDLGRYGNIVAGLDKKSYPALVSFVGPTGSGKSTLIKMLMELDYSGVQPYETPVVKSAACFNTIPTSGDVHLFCDPHTCQPNSERPILYADCEGLEGGERTPLGSRTLKREKLQKRISEHLPGTKQDTKPSFPHHSKETRQSWKRELKWATTDMTKRREFVVSELYPRILYTFSDVVVFVLRETNKLESVIERLLIWAAAALEKSSNQPVLPCAIIAMNSLPTEGSEAFWDTNIATSEILNEANIEFHRNPKFKRFIRRWEERGTRVESVWGLLHLYYDNLRVVRIPRKGRSTLIKAQVSRLYSEIKICCQHSHRMKRERRMLMSAPTLQTHLQSAYDHFAQSLDTAFDFVKATFAHNPIPSDFGGNILKLILEVKAHSSVRNEGYSILRMTAPMIASCIMLDAARQGIAGKAWELFPEYSPSCDDAFQDFFDKHWECEYRNPADPSVRCVNYRVGHSTKGHQDSNGKIISSGEYVSLLTEKHAEVFRDLVMAYLISIENRIDDDPEREAVDERTLVSKFHRDEYLGPFYYDAGGADNYVSHSACLVCLVHSPEHHLQCGHVICTPCLQTYGNAKPGCITIAYCPMHRVEREFYPYQIFTIKPPSAGVRVLSLDGGGVRGLSQLIMLEYLENALGFDLQLTSFFDLIVGTSTGAHIALGLAAKNWTIMQCIHQFKEMCKETFIVRKWIEWPGVQHIVGNITKYRTLPLESAIKKTFSTNEYLFGGVKTSSKPAPKVAVTTSSTSGKPIVLGNYSRAESGTMTYDFPRPERPENEFKLWEVARATFAAPKYFKAYSHTVSNEIYIDGGIYNYNPIYIADAERRLIWPEVQHSPPDLVLSLGSGYNPRPKPRKQKKFRARGVAQTMERLQWIATDHIESSVAADETWKSWLATRPPSRNQGENRYVRLNIKFEEYDDPPHFDDLNAFQRIEFEARKQTQSFGKQIKLLADHLICSTFYFEVNEMSRFSDFDGYTREVRCKGTIHCRLNLQPTDIRKLGMFFLSLNDRRNLDPSWKPYFTVRERTRERAIQPRYFISEKVTSEMLNLSRFDFPQIEFIASGEDALIEISLCLDKSSEFPISGFPCQILTSIQNGIAPRNLSWRRTSSQNSKKQNCDGTSRVSSSSGESITKNPTPGQNTDSKKFEMARMQALNNSLALFFKPRSSTHFKVPEDVFELPADVPSVVAEVDGQNGQNAT
ncbi:hypothetical protein H072_10759 [Dactylellina haptotyla CBS 200.50]|uniref:PNPLA domain-containing protein n=1 Tax=Dactylellina haptotyla (strain CBS 200.50) TaxID=1284197 RepID=S8B9L3_DACHA|nr:hypothetical protein H072_10759 [Dactylellina haptotyla CBS 200.50]